MGTTPSIRLYGRFRDHSSEAQVSAGWKSVLEERGMLAGCYPVDEEIGWDEPPPPGASAPIGVLTGPPAQVWRMTHAAKHAERYAVLAPNSNRIPAALQQAYEKACTGVLTPSKWAAGVLRSIFGDQLPVNVVRHGLSSDFRPSAELEEILARTEQSYSQYEFRVLHLSTTHRERKGTMQLLRAWKELMQRNELPISATLTLVLDRDATRGVYAQLLDDGEDLPPGVRIEQRWGAVERGASASEAARSYAGYHVVCQPSRGEAFGLVPLEARAIGVPVVATACTGHAEHLDGCGIRDGVIIVEHGAPEPLDDLPGSVAPAVKQSAIALGIVRAYTHWRELREGAKANAEAVAEQWSWTAQLRGFVDSRKGKSND